ncbi:MAG: hypothetical protein K8S56_06755 [Candidatus Cloacimonetes bacterium]|nr:hypothetical protein [Candidatus Cloacimonadota bacterium]
MTPLHYVQYLVVVGASLLVPIAAIGLAIVFGYPMTTVIRRVTKMTEHDKIDIHFIAILIYLIDGFICVLLAFLLFRIFNLEEVTKEAIFLILIARIGFAYWKKNLGGANSGELFEEIVNLVILTLGLVVGSFVFRII